MSSTLVSALHNEERSIVAELRASRPFQRLEGIHKLLSLYDAQPSVAVSFGAPEAERGAAPVIQLAPPASAPIPMPGPVGAAAEAAIAEATRAAPAAMAAPAAAPVAATMAAAHEEPAGVVSSVRAALLGIGKA
jgi:hypothetical protein